MEPIIIASVIFLFSLALGAVVVWYVLRRRQAAEVKEEEGNKPATRLAFRWKYILLPMAILLISVILSQDQVIMTMAAVT